MIENEEILKLLETEIQRLENEIEKIKPSELEPVITIVLSVLLMFAPVIYSGGLHSKTIYITNNSSIQIPYQDVILHINLTSTNIQDNSTIYVLNIQDIKFARNYNKTAEIQIIYPSQIQYFEFNGGAFYTLFFLGILELMSLIATLIIIGRSMILNKRLPTGMANTFRALSIMVTLVSAAYIIIYLSLSAEGKISSFSWWEEIVTLVSLVPISTLSLGTMGWITSPFLEELETNVDRPQSSLRSKKVIGFVITLIVAILLIIVILKIIWPIPLNGKLKIVYTFITMFFSIAVILVLFNYYNKIRVINNIRVIQGDLIKIKQVLISTSNGQITLARELIISQKKMMLGVIQTATIDILPKSTCNDFSLFSAPIPDKQK